MIFNDFVGFILRTFGQMSSEELGRGLGEYTFSAHFLEFSAMVQQRCGEKQVILVIFGDVEFLRSFFQKPFRKSVTTDFAQ